MKRFKKNIIKHEFHDKIFLASIISMIIIIFLMFLLKVMGILKIYIDLMSYIALLNAVVIAWICVYPGEGSDKNKYEGKFKIIDEIKIKDAETYNNKKDIINLFYESRKYLTKEEKDMFTWRRLKLEKDEQRYQLFFKVQKEYLRYIFAGTIGSVILKGMLEWDKLLEKKTIISYGILFLSIIITLMRLVLWVMNTNYKYEYLNDITRYEQNLLNEILK